MAEKNINQNIIHIDGNYQEGGGQIVRTALALSAITGKPFKATNIRSGRPVPGLKAQHITCVKALQELCNADVEGLKLGSESISFYPKKLQPKNLSIDIGTAGSITLVMQSLLLPLIFTKQETRITLKGGTDVPWSQPIDYFSNVFCRLIGNVADIKVQTKFRGFYPKGGGLAIISIFPKKEFGQFELISHEEILSINGNSFASDSLKGLDVAERQLNSAKNFLEQIAGLEIGIEYARSLSPGSGIVLWGTYNKTVIGSDALGKKGKPAELVGEEAAKKLIEEINSGAVVDSNAADSLIPFLGVAFGKIKTSKITKHTLANIYVVEKFLGVKFTIENKDNIISVFEQFPL